jgi:N utilization substance protein A
MSSSIAQNIEALCQEQGIERDLVIEAMKEAVRAAAKKQFRSGEDIQVDWNAETGIELSASKVVVDEVENPATELSITEARELAGDEVELGDALLLPVADGRTRPHRRPNSQTDSLPESPRRRPQQRLRTIHRQDRRPRQRLRQTFRTRQHHRRPRNLEAILPRSQQSRGEQWNQGERIRVVINNVSKESKGPQVEVSRTSPELLLRLFEMEVPEIYDGTVVIKSAVREPGERAKIAVMSTSATSIPSAPASV